MSVVMLWSLYINGHKAREFSGCSRPRLSDIEFKKAEKVGGQLISLGQHIVPIDAACSAIIAAVNQLS